MVITLFSWLCTEITHSQQIIKYPILAFTSVIVNADFDIFAKNSDLMLDELWFSRYSDHQSIQADPSQYFYRISTLP